MLLLTMVSLPAWGQTAVYRGRTYTSRVCTSPNCSMCNRIEAQLNAYRLPAVPVLRAQPAQAHTLPVVETAPAGLADTTLEPSPQWAVEAMLELAMPTAGDTVLDLGCGDGRILIEAARRYQARAIGIELNADSADLARANAKAAAVDGLVTVLTGDVLSLKQYEADVVTLYLFPDLIEAVWPRIAPGTVVVSLNHPLPAPYVRREVRRHGDDMAVFYVGVKRRP